LEVLLVQKEPHVITLFEGGPVLSLFDVRPGSKQFLDLATSPVVAPRQVPKLCAKLQHLGQIILFDDVRRFSTERIGLPGQIG
jgi:hypothetical protein